MEGTISERSYFLRLGKFDDYDSLIESKKSREFPIDYGIKKVFNIKRALSSLQKFLSLSSRKLQQPFYVFMMSALISRLSVWEKQRSWLGEYKNGRKHGYGNTG